jgi:hypothetical protein
MDKQHAASPPNRRLHGPVALALKPSVLVPSQPSSPPHQQSQECCGRNKLVIRTMRCLRESSNVVDNRDRRNNLFAFFTFRHAIRCWYTRGKATVVGSTKVRTHGAHRYTAPPNKQPKDKRKQRRDEGEDVG